MFDDERLCRVRSRALELRTPAEPVSGTAAFWFRVWSFLHDSDREFHPARRGSARLS